MWDSPDHRAPPALAGCPERMATLPLPDVELRGGEHASVEVHGSTLVLTLDPPRRSALETGFTNAGPDRALECPGLAVSFVLVD